MWTCVRVIRVVSYDIKYGFEWFGVRTQWHRVMCILNKHVCLPLNALDTTTTTAEFHPRNQQHNNRYTVVHNVPERKYVHSRCCPPLLPTCDDQVVGRDVMRSRGFFVRMESARVRSKRAPCSQTSSHRCCRHQTDSAITDTYHRRAAAALCVASVCGGYRTHARRIKYILK